jgi:hypothetical protein
MSTVNVWAETKESGETILFAFDYPGACGWGPTWSHAAERLKHDTLFTTHWMSKHGAESDAPSNMNLHVVEAVEATGNPLECDSEGFYSWDNEPFEDTMIDETLRWLNASRVDLLSLVQGLGDDVLDKRLTEGKRTVREIIDHIAIAEWWYTTRVSSSRDSIRSWENYGQDAFSRLQLVREMFVHDFAERMRQMPYVNRSQVFERNGELWTPKKVLRRAVWHELLHLKQLLRLIPKLTQ